jgi:hypothetical protein
MDATTRDSRKMHTDSLRRALERTCELLFSSEESIWSPLSPKEVADNLMLILSAIDRGHSLDRVALSAEFAPTGTIQEIAMENGWHDEYMRLAAVVDRCVENDV